MTRVMERSLPVPCDTNGPRKAAIMSDADFGALVTLLMGTARQAFPSERSTQAASEDSMQVKGTDDMLADRGGDLTLVPPEMYALLVALLTAPATPAARTPEALVALGYDPASAAATGMGNSVVPIVVQEIAGETAISAPSSPPDADATQIPRDLLATRTEPLMSSDALNGGQIRSEGPVPAVKPGVPPPALGMTTVSALTAGDAVDAGLLVHARHWYHVERPERDEYEQSDASDLLRPLAQDASAKAGTAHAVVGTGGVFQSVGPVATSDVGAPRADHMLEQVIDRVESALAARQTSVRVRLEPESLGPIDLTLIARDGGIAVRMVVENYDTQHKLVRDLHDLRQGLSDRGLAVQHIQIEEVARTATDSPGPDVSSGTPQFQAGARQGQRDPGTGTGTGTAREQERRDSVRLAAVVDPASGAIGAVLGSAAEPRAVKVIDIRA